MSTQNQGTVPFALASDSQNFRLIELTPEVAELLSQPDPPTLHIKSQARNATQAAQNGSYNPSTAANAHLCTPNKTYQLRSVGTSNSLFITQPATFPAASGDADDLPQAGICAIAQSAITLELLPSKESALEYLINLLPVWRMSGTAVAEHQLRSKSQSFDDIPFSNLEITSAWREMCAFELDGQAYRPATEDLLAAWKAVTAAAYAERIDLMNGFEFQSLWIAMQDEGYPEPLLLALVQRLCGEHTGTPSQKIDTTQPIRFTATLLLSLTAQTADGIPTSAFVKEWHELLPEETWRSHATVANIADLTFKPSASHIMLKTTHEELAKKARGGNLAGGRKWHEKFKAGRR